MDKFENFENKKGLLILYGESFRTGNRNTRIRDLEECIEPQKNASNTHNELIQYVKKRYNISMDVLINTYDTKYEKELKGYYENPTFYSHKELLGWDKICQTAIDKVDKSKYSFILFTRIDIFIKPEFNTLFNPSWDKIKFLSPMEDEILCGFRKDKNGIHYPYTNPIFVFYPEKYFYVLNNMNAGHDIWSHYMDEHHLTENDMDFMVDYQFDANTATVKNPYYKMTGREEGPIYMDENKKIKKQFIGKNYIDC